VFRAVFSQSDVLLPFLNDVLSLGPGKAITSMTTRRRGSLASNAKRTASRAKKAAPEGEAGVPGEDITCVLNTGEGCIVEMQHAADFSVLQRLLMHGALEMVQHSQTSGRGALDLSGDSFMPLHLVAVCSFDFYHDAAGDRLAVTRANTAAEANNSFIQVFRFQADMEAIESKSGPGKDFNKAAEIELGKLLTITLISLPRCAADPADAKTDAERWGSILSNTSLAVNQDWRSWPAKYHGLLSAVSSKALIAASDAADLLKQKYQADAWADVEVATARADAAEARVSQLRDALAAAGVQAPA